MDANLYPMPTFPARPPADVRLVGDFVQGRQFGVDVAHYGRPYVFARHHVDAVWLMWAGPFVDEAAAVAWIERKGS